jgi:hypothetical protein
MVTFRNKETGKLYVLIGSCSGGDGSYFTLATQPDEESEGSVIVKVPFPEAFKNFETVDDQKDYASVLPMIVNYIHLIPSLNNLFDAFLRRNTKDYYVPGKYVYVKFACAIDPRSYHGPEDNIYIIKSIGRGQYGKELVLVKDLTQPEDREIRFKFNIDRIENDDAFSCIRRLDMPF